MGSTYRNWIHKLIKGLLDVDFLIIYFVKKWFFEECGVKRKGNVTGSMQNYFIGRMVHLKMSLEKRKLSFKESVPNGAKRTSVNEFRMKSWNIWIGF